MRRTDTTGVANPFTGLVFCADCGAKMYNHRGRHTKPDGREYRNDTYDCSTYCLAIERETKQCFSHSVSTRALTELVLETIRTTARVCPGHRKAFIQKVRSISRVRQQEAAKELSRRVAKAKKRITELDILIKKLYETYVHAPDKSKGYREQQIDISYDLVGILPAALLNDLQNGERHSPQATPFPENNLCCFMSAALRPFLFFVSIYILSRR